MSNSSERSLRRTVIWQKLSFATQSAAGSRFAGTIPRLDVDLAKDAAMDNWLTAARGRLASASFVLLEDVPFEGRTFRLIARRTRFELTKFGFSESFFVFGQFDRLTNEALRQFSADAFRFAKKTRVIPLPCGLFESVFCYAVAITKAVDEPTLTSVRFDTPPKHWAAAEIPVVYDRTQGKLSCFEKTPLWGSAYYRGFRKQIRQFLGEIGQA
jgi:hypothetical protein